MIPCGAMDELSQYNVLFTKMRLKKIAYNLPFLNPIYSFFYFIFLGKSAKEKKEKKRAETKEKTTSLKVYRWFGVGF